MIQKIIAESLTMDHERVQRIVRSASYRYFHFQIDKKTGGVRDIYHPAQELKLLQRWVNSRLLHRLPVSFAATAYEEHSSIISNARKHANSRYLLRLDFSDFFPSLKAQDVRRVFAAHFGSLQDIVQSDSDIEAICKIVCRFDQLTIGAPSSPFLSNRILEPFDTFCLMYSREKEVTYTRYADDLFFSTSKANVLEQFPFAVGQHLSRAEGPKLRLNDSKTVFSSKKSRRLITGLRITSESKVSLGRDAKRSIRTKVYLALNNRLEDIDIQKLRGLLAFAQDVEPAFFACLQTKFGLEQIKRFSM